MSAAISLEAAGKQQQIAHLSGRIFAYAAPPNLFFALMWLTLLIRKQWLVTSNC
jgi:hypothetical protein